MKVCIVAEGCYPYVVGGVSSWVHSLIQQFPNIEFTLAAIVADRTVSGKFAYKLPDNLTEVREIYLNDRQWLTGGKKHRMAKVTLNESEYQAVRGLVLGEHVDWGVVFRLFQEKDMSIDQLLMGKDFLNIAREVYELRYSNIVFSDFLWTLRSIYLPLGFALQFRPAEAEGVPQGGPLSPLCGNVMLNELDKELERRGHKFVRYADDCMILCRSRKSAERTLKHIIPFITEKLYLKINLEKTTVSHISKVKYLGYGFYRYKGKCRMRVHPKSIQKMKKRLRELTARGNKWSNPEREEKLRKYTTGWINYYRYADMKNLLVETDEWLRHRIRAVYWKQWKKVRTRYKIFRALHLPEWKVHELANCRKGTWRAASMLNSVLTKTIIVDRLGYPSMTAHYLKVRVNY